MKDSQASKADNARVPEYLWDDRVMAVLLAVWTETSYWPRCRVIRRVLRFWRKAWPWAFTVVEEGAEGGTETSAVDEILVARALHHRCLPWWDWETRSTPFFGGGPGECS
jgi:hypothetical protein